MFTFRFLLNLAATIFHNFAAGINQRWRRRTDVAEWGTTMFLVICFGQQFCSHRTQAKATQFSICLPLSLPFPPFLLAPSFYYFFLPTKAGRDPEENVATGRGGVRRVRVILGVALEVHLEKKKNKIKTGTLNALSAEVEILILLADAFNL